METIIVLMEKDEKTGFLEREIGSISLSEGEEFIVNLYVERGKLHIKLSADRDVSDWEYDAIFDYFDPSVFEGLVGSVSECEDCYNPTWEFTADFDEGDIEGCADNIKRIIASFKKEIYEVYETIKDKEAEYSNE